MCSPLCKEENFVLFRRYICAVSFFPPITGGGWGRIKVKLISNPGLLLFFSFSFLQFSLPAAARLLFHFFSAAAFIHEEKGRGGNKQNENGSCLFTRSHDSMPIKHRHSVSRLSFLIRHPSSDRASEREGETVGPARREKRPGEKSSCPGQLHKWSPASAFLNILLYFCEYFSHLHLIVPYRSSPSAHMEMRESSVAKSRRFKSRLLIIKIYN